MYKSMRNFLGVAGTEKYDLRSTYNISQELVLLPPTLPIQWLMTMLRCLAGLGWYWTVIRVNVKLVFLTHRMYSKISHTFHNVNLEQCDVNCFQTSEF